jgi:ATP-dependent RNA helicase MRH4
MLLSDIALARSHSIPFDLDLPPADPETPPPAPIKYPFNFLLSTATIPSSLASYLDTYHPTLTRLASPNLHHLPRSLKTEYIGWSGGNRNADVESRIRRVWAEDSLRGESGEMGVLSKVFVFCIKWRIWRHFWRRRGLGMSL